MLELELASLLGISAPVVAGVGALVLIRRWRHRQNSPRTSPLTPLPAALQNQATTLPKGQERWLWILRLLRRIPGYVGSRLQQLVETLITPSAFMAWS